MQPTPVNQTCSLHLSIKHAVMFSDVCDSVMWCKPGAILGFSF